MKYLAIWYDSLKISFNYSNYSFFSMFIMNSKCDAQILNLVSWSHMAGYHIMWLSQTNCALFNNSLLYIVSKTYEGALNYRQIHFHTYFTYVYYLHCCVVCVPDSTRQYVAYQINIVNTFDCQCSSTSPVSEHARDWANNRQRPSPLEKGIKRIQIFRIRCACPMPGSHVFCMLSRSIKRMRCAYTFVGLHILISLLNYLLMPIATTTLAVRRQQQPSVQRGWIKKHTNSGGATVKTACEHAGMTHKHIYTLFACVCVCVDAYKQTSLCTCMVDAN